MKIFYLLLLVLVSQVEYSFGSLGVAKVKPVDGKCSYGGHLFAPGEKVNLKTPCVRYECSKATEDEYFVHSASCGIAKLSEALRSKCHFEPTDGPYPNCCPHRVVCTGQGGSRYKGLQCECSNYI